MYHGYKPHRLSRRTSQDISLRQGEQHFIHEASGCTAGRGHVSLLQCYRPPWRPACVCTHDPGKTRTCNLWLRRPTPFPLCGRTLNKPCATSGSRWQTHLAVIPPLRSATAKSASQRPGRPRPRGPPGESHTCRACIPGDGNRTLRTMCKHHHTPPACSYGCKSSCVRTLLAVVFRTGGVTTRCVCQQLPDVARGAVRALWPNG